MAPSLADSIAHALGLLSIDGEAVVSLGTELGRYAAGLLLGELMDTYMEIFDEQPSNVSMSIAADFASRFLPTFADMFINSAFGSGETSLIYSARMWLLNMTKTPAFGLLLRERPDTCKVVLASQLAALTSHEAYWDSRVLIASSPDGYERRRFLVVLATTVYQLVFVASLHGQRTMCFTVGTAVVKANLARLHRSLDQHRREGSPEQSQMIDKGLHFLKLIRFHLDRDLVLEPTSSMSDYLYWMRCEATVLPGSSPCVKLPAGEEMACCAKCLGVRYCSQAHQKAHWKTHKPLCFKPTW